MEGLVITDGLPKALKCLAESPKVLDFVIGQSDFRDHFQENGFCAGFCVSRLLKKLPAPLAVRAIIMVQAIPEFPGDKELAIGLVKHARCGQ